MFRSEIGNVGSITFLSERSVLCFLLSEDDNLCLSDWSELLFLSFQLVKDEKSRPSCLACSDTAELRYLICIAQSFELSFGKSFCNVFSLNSASLRH